MFIVNETVRFKKDVTFEYGDGHVKVEARVGDILQIQGLDDDGYWFKDGSFYIEQGSADEFFELV